ncbi:MAG: cytidylyltransferase [Parcubacteria group bacterium]|jgi:CMP-N-acetylneuraminic acid synthetase|nr:cytidylyltransferase [Parcubacteria group bacterium]|tara:strand:+ start:7075 stop:7740 length:666 start_codon:yes stop_codon:yes gene_type:complete
MKILAVITARKNSKRLPNKNKIKLGKLPLFVWSIKAAKNIKEICDILVSTDDKEILKISKKLKVLTPWLRPKNLSTNKSKSVDVVLHALNWYENNFQKVDGVLLLQPTSPFRMKKTIKTGINLFKKNFYKPVLGVSKSRHNPFLTYKISKGYLVRLFKQRKQELMTYYVNGVLYLISAKDLRKTKSFFNNKSVPLIINSPKEYLDIDHFWDLKVARSFLSV